MLMTSTNPNIEIAMYPIFYCRRRGAEAKGFLLDDGSFIILKGSRIAKGTTPSCSKITDDLRKSLSLKNYILQRNTLLQSPSSASNVVSGANSNGWDEWTDLSGATLGSYRNNK